MGKTKSKSLRKASKTINAAGVKFNGNFEKNKKILVGLTLSKKLRNQMAGLMTRTRKQELVQIEAEKARRK
jgi:ribosomal protein S17E